MNENKNSNIPTFIAGAIIGATLTYLFGTKSGQKVKEEIVKEGQKLLDKMSEGLEEVRDKIEESDVPEKISAKAKDAQEKVSSGLEGALAKGEEAAEEIPEHIAQIQKKGRRFFFRRSHSES